MKDSKRLARHVQQSLVEATGAIDRGVKHARFVVLIGTKVPAILIEAGFLTNSVEGRKLATSAYQHKIATAIAQGVIGFWGKKANHLLLELGGQNSPLSVLRGVDDVFEQTYKSTAIMLNNNNPFRVYIALVYYWGVSSCRSTASRDCDCCPVSDLSGI